MIYNAAGLTRTALMLVVAAAAAPDLSALPQGAAYSGAGLTEFRYRDAEPIPADGWIPGAQGDSAYLEARRALNEEDFSRAAFLFRRLRERNPDSPYSADSFYWEAFALHRLGGTTNLRSALASLAEQKERFPSASTRRDALALETRIQGMLARQGDADAAERIVERSQVEGCPSEDEDMRLAAMNALQHMNSVQAVPILKKVLERRDPCSLTLRRKAVFILSQQRSSEREEILLATARSDPDHEVREQAVFWLSQVRTEAAVDALDSILTFAEDRRLQERAIFALSQHRSARAGEILKAYAEQTERPIELRAQAIQWLGQTRGTSAFLMELYQRLDEDELREKVIFAMSQQRDAEAGNWLIERALDQTESIEVRKKALFWAGQSRGVDVARLFDIYRQASDREMREQVIYVLSQRRESEALDRLIEVARTETDQDIRKRAIFWLGQSRDPRAAEFLLEIINQ